MAIASKKNRNAGWFSNGYCEAKISSTIYGGKLSKINKKQKVFSNDSMYVFYEFDDMEYEVEIGIYKKYYKFTNEEGVDGCKQLDFKENNMFKKIVRDYGF